MHYFLQEEEEDFMNLDLGSLLEDVPAVEVVKEKKVEMSNK